MTSHTAALPDGATANGSGARSPSVEQLTDSLRTVAVNSSYHASRALSKWFKRGVRLSSDGFTHIGLDEAGSLLGDPEQPIVAVRMNLGGQLQGDIVIAMAEPVAYRLVDLLIMAPAGTTQSLGEMEASCLQETGNIVASSFVNSLSHWLHLPAAPEAPVVVADLACAVIEPLVIAQAELGDQILMATTTFELDGECTDWGLLLLPSSASLNLMRRQCEMESVRRSALHTIAVNGAFDASRALSKWFHCGVNLTTQGFERVPLRNLSSAACADEQVVALHMPLSDQLHGHALMMIPISTALRLSAMLLGTVGEAPASDDDSVGVRSLTELELSCIQETGNILGSSFVNSWCKWLEVHAEPGVPELTVDVRDSIMTSLVLEQAGVGDDIYLSRTAFTMDHQRLEWEFFLLPTPTSLRLIEASCSDD